MLAHETLLKLRVCFDARNHRPSVDQWAALADLANTFEALANSTAAPRFYLSSLDPGVGKSQTLIKFVDVLLSSVAHTHVGVLFCVSRLTEVERMVDDMCIPKDMLCVVTSDQRLNALSGATADSARVVITTQQMLERRVINGTFNAFTFQGEPRAVRVWDEAWLPGHPVTLSVDDMAFVLRRLSYLSAELRSDVLSIFNDVEKLATGATYSVPDFADKHATINLNDALGTTAGGGSDADATKFRDDERAAISSLWYVSGKTVTIRRDGRFGNAVLDFKQTLPNDLAPMVILDASGRVRQTYVDLEANGGLVRLLSAPKRYDPLTVHVWRTGGGKSAFTDNGAKLTAGIAKTIDTRPTEKWLVVGHRPNSRVGNIEKAVRDLLCVTDQANVSFINWGSHSATNVYADVPNVILAGTLFYRGSYYEGLKRLASDRPAEAGAVTDAEMKATELGEHAHLILQALCRGSVRKSDDDKCQPARAWVIASVRSGIPSALPGIFPGCRVLRWSPIPTTLKGHAKTTQEYVERWTKGAKAGDVLPFKLIQRDVGVDRWTFQKNVRPSAPLGDALAELGVVEWGKARYCTGYRLVETKV